GPHVLVLTVDAFGEEVAARLAATTRTTVHDVSRGTHQSLWPAADLIVLSGAREQPRIAEAIDAASFIRVRPWFPISWHGNEIHVGPVVRPGRTACLRCFTRRRDQHTRPDALVAAGDQPAAAPTGHARHHVAIAASLAAQAMREALAPVTDVTEVTDVTDVAEVTESAATAADPTADLGASVRVFNQVTGALAKVPVVAVDGCRRCGTRFEPAAARRAALWRRLEQELDATPPGAAASPAAPALPVVAG
ncbi:MAG: TOMM precursor leader peptide-binding protein, partial [Angustibacter sp.]